MVLTWQEFLAERPLGVFMTVGEDGLPHGTPVELVVDGDRVYCWTQRSSVKVRNAERTGRAALVSYKGNSFVLLRGTVRVLAAAEAGDYDRLTKRFLEKYKRDETYGNDALLELTPERVTAVGV